MAAVVASGIAETEKYLAREFLGDDHFKCIHQALASRWDRLHSLSAAMKLMEEYGVKLTPEEEQRLAGLDESQQINALVMKMPQQSNEQFQQFFLQLQLLVSTATRVRRSLEEGRPDLVDEALNDADSTGISQYILRMAIVQAGSEVALLKEQYIAWLKDVDHRCGKLIRGQEDCRTAQMRLAAAQAQLSSYTAGQNEKAKKVMMNFAAQSDKGLVAAVFSGWRGYAKQAKAEAEIRAEYAGRLEMAERKLAEVKEKQLGNARGMMMRKAVVNDGQLVTEIFRIWRDEVKEATEKAQNADKVAELEQKLQGMKASSTGNTKRVMMRMNADNDYQLVGMVWQAFVTHHKDYQKNKDWEDQVANSERKINQFLKTQSEGAKKVLEKMGGGTNSGVVQQTFGAWKEVWDERRKEAEIEAKLNGADSKLSAFGSKAKDSGKGALDRSRYHIEIGLLLRMWHAWRLDLKMEGRTRFYKEKVEAKRSQLLGVQHMFRRFAQEIDANFRSGEETSRDLRNGPPILRRSSKAEGGQDRRLSQGYGSTSLPDITKPTSGRMQEKPSSGRPQKPGTPSGNKVRTPTGYSPHDGSPARSPVLQSRPIH